MLHSTFRCQVQVSFSATHSLSWHGACQHTWNLPQNSQDLAVASPMCLGWRWRWKWACGHHTLLSFPWMSHSSMFIQLTSSCHSEQLKCCFREVLPEFLIQCTHPNVPGNVDFTLKTLTALFFSCGCWLMFLYPGLALSELLCLCLTPSCGVTLSPVFQLNRYFRVKNGFSIPLPCNIQCW